MSQTTVPPNARRQIPRRFEDYIAHWTPLGRARCEGCGREDLNCWRTDAPEPMIECEACARKAHAVDVEEENIVFATFDGIVRGLCEAGVPVELIRAAALQAIDDAFPAIDDEERPERRRRVEAMLAPVERREARG